MPVTGISTACGPVLEQGEGQTAPVEPSMFETARVYVRKYWCNSFVFNNTVGQSVRR